MAMIFGVTKASESLQAWDDNILFFLHHYIMMIQNLKTNRK